jgi:quercetin dioxygenase-like cupin family protein
LSFAAQKPNRTTPAAPPEQQDAIELSADPAFQQTFSNDKVSVYRLELAPQASTQLDRHERDYILLALTGAHLQATDGKHTNELTVEPEGMQVLKGGWPHKIVNQGDNAATAIIVVPAAKLDPEHAMCGLAARQCKAGEIGDELGKFTESVLFDTPTAKLIQAEVAAGAQIPPTDYVHPVLLVAMTPVALIDARQSMQPTADQPQGENAQSTKNQPGESPIQLKPGDTFYLPGETTDALKNAGKDDARFVLLTLRPGE